MENKIGHRKQDDKYFKKLQENQSQQKNNSFTRNRESVKLQSAGTFNLKEKRHEGFVDFEYDEKDVKEFIRLIEKDIENQDPFINKISIEKVKEIIKNRSGDL